MGDSGIRRSIVRNTAGNYFGFAVNLQYAFMAFILAELDLGWRDVWSAAVRPTALPALVAFLALWVWLGPQPFWLVPAAATSSALYAGSFWSGTRATERADLLSHAPGPLRAVLAA